MDTFVRIEKGHESVGIMIGVIELPDLKLECVIRCEPEIKTSVGEEYPTGLIQVLCGDGMRIARRRLSIERGLQVTVSRIYGRLERANEAGICHATCLAIAKALSRDDSSLIATMEDWSMVD